MDDVGTQEPVRRAGRQRRTGAVTTGLVALLAGLLFATNAQVFAGDGDRHPQNLEELARKETERLVELEEQNATLREAIQPYLDEGDGEPQAGSTNGLAAQAAGAVPVEGSALEVTLWDAPQVTEGIGAEIPPDALVVHQQDIEAVMNALWAGGAEAMAVQGQRVISTSGVRCVGNVLYIHGRTYSPPYTIAAVGDPDQMERALLAEPGVRTYLEYVDAVGLGWSVRELPALELPAYAGSLTLQHARALDPAA